MGDKIDFSDVHDETYHQAVELVEKSQEWSEVLPLPVMEVPSFPIEVLPKWLAEFAKDVALSTQTPIDLAGCLVLTAIALCSAKKAEVEPKQGWREPLNIYTLVAMESGSGKSPVFKQVLEPIFDYEEEMNRNIKADTAQAQQEKETLSRRREKVRGDAARHKDPIKRQELEAEIKRLTEEIESFEVPVSIRYTTNDVTPEKLASLMHDNGERMGLLDSEGGIFEMIAGRYNNNTPNLDLVLKAHSGDVVKVDRKGSEPLSLRYPALTVGLTVQPGVMRGLAQKDGFRDRGLLARFLYSIPGTNLGYREFYNAGVRRKVVDKYESQLKALLYVPLPETPKRFVFSPEAFIRFGKFWKEVEEQFKPEQPLFGLVDWGGKYRGAVARISGLLHIADTLSFDVQTIPLETLERAIRLGEYFKAHALAVFAEMGLSGKSEACRNIVQWIVKEKVTIFSKRQLHRALGYRFPTADMLSAPLALLEERGYIRESAGSRVGGRGRKPSPTYEVNPSRSNILPIETTQMTELPPTSQNGVKSGHDRIQGKYLDNTTEFNSEEVEEYFMEGEV